MAEIKRLTAAQRLANALGKQGIKAFVDAQREDILHIAFGDPSKAYMSNYATMTVGEIDDPNDATLPGRVSVSDKIFVNASYDAGQNIYGSGFEFAADYIKRAVLASKNPSDFHKTFQEMSSPLLAHSLIGEHGQTNPTLTEQILNTTLVIRSPAYSKALPQWRALVEKKAEERGAFLGINVGSTVDESSFSDTVLMTPLPKGDLGYADYKRFRQLASRQTFEPVGKYPGSGVFKTESGEEMMWARFGVGRTPGAGGGMIVAKELQARRYQANREYKIEAGQLQGFSWSQRTMFGGVENIDIAKGGGRNISMPIGGADAARVVSRNLAIGYGKETMEALEQVFGEDAPKSLIAQAYSAPLIAGKKELEQQVAARAQIRAMLAQKLGLPESDIIDSPRRGISVEASLEIDVPASIKGFEAKAYTQEVDPSLAKKGLFGIINSDVIKDYRAARSSELTFYLQAPLSAMNKEEREIAKKIRENQKMGIAPEKSYEELLPRIAQLGLYHRVAPKSQFFTAQEHANAGRIASSTMAMGYYGVSPAMQDLAQEMAREYADREIGSVIAALTGRATQELSGPNPLGLRPTATRQEIIEAMYARGYDPSKSFMRNGQVYQSIISAGAEGNIFRLIKESLLADNPEEINRRYKEELESVYGGVGTKKKSAELAAPQIGGPARYGDINDLSTFGTIRIGRQQVERIARQLSNQYGARVRPEQIEKLVEEGGVFGQYAGFPNVNKTVVLPIALERDPEKYRQMSEAVVPGLLALVFDRDSDGDTHGITPLLKLKRDKNGNFVNENGLAVVTPLENALPAYEQQAPIEKLALERLASIVGVKPISEMIEAGATPLEVIKKLKPVIPGHKKTINVLAEHESDMLSPGQFFEKVAKGEAKSGTAADISRSAADIAATKRQMPIYRMAKLLQFAFDTNMPSAFDAAFNTPEHNALGLSAYRIASRSFENSYQIPLDFSKLPKDLESLMNTFNTMDGRTNRHDANVREIAYKLAKFAQESVDTGASIFRPEAIAGLLTRDVKKMTQIADYIRKYGNLDEMQGHFSDIVDSPLDRAIRANEAINFFMNDWMGRYDAMKSDTASIREWENLYARNMAFIEKNPDFLDFMRVAARGAFPTDMWYSMTSGPLIGQIIENAIEAGAGPGASTIPAKKPDIMPRRAPQAPGYAGSNRAAELVRRDRYISASEASSLLNSAWAEETALRKGIEAVSQRQLKVSISNAAIAGGMRMERVLAGDVKEFFGDEEKARAVARRAAEELGHRFLSRDEMVERGVKSPSITFGDIRTSLLPDYLKLEGDSVLMTDVKTGRADMEKYQLQQSIYAQGLVQLANRGDGEELVSFLTQASDIDEATAHRIKDILRKKGAGGIKAQLFVAEATDDPFRDAEKINVPIMSASEVTRSLAKAHRSYEMRFRQILPQIISALDDLYISGEHVTPRTGTKLTVSAAKGVDAKESIEAVRTRIQEQIQFEASGRQEDLPLSKRGIAGGSGRPAAQERISFAGESNEKLLSAIKELTETITQSAKGGGFFGRRQRGVDFVPSRDWVNVVNASFSESGEFLGMPDDPELAHKLGKKQMKFMNRMNFLSSMSYSQAKQFMDLVTEMDAETWRQARVSGDYEGTPEQSASKRLSYLRNELSKRVRTSREWRESQISDFKKWSSELASIVESIKTPEAPSDPSRYMEDKRYNQVSAFASAMADATKQFQKLSAGLDTSITTIEKARKEWENTYEVIKRLNRTTSDAKATGMPILDKYIDESKVLQGALRSAFFKGGVIGDELIERFGPEKAEEVMQAAAAPDGKWMKAGQFANRLLSGYFAFQALRTMRYTFNPVVQASEQYGAGQIQTISALSQNAPVGAYDITGTPSFAANRFARNLSYGFGANAQNIIAGLTKMSGGSGIDLGRSILGTAGSVLAPGIGAGALVFGSLAPMNPAAALAAGAAVGAGVSAISAISYMAGASEDAAGAVRGLYSKDQVSDKSLIEKVGNALSDFGGALSSGQYAARGIVRESPIIQAAFNIPFFGESWKKSAEFWLGSGKRDADIARAAAELSEQRRRGGPFDVSSLSPLAASTLVSEIIPKDIADKYNIPMDAAKELASLVYGGGADAFTSEYALNNLAKLAQTGTDVKEYAQLMEQYSAAAGRRLPSQIIEAFAYGKGVEVGPNGEKGLIPINELKRRLISIENAGGLGTAIRAVQSGAASSLEEARDQQAALNADPLRGYVYTQGVEAEYINQILTGERISETNKALYKLAASQGISAQQLAQLAIESGAIRGDIDPRSALNTYIPRIATADLYSEQSIANKAFTRAGGLASVRMMKWAGLTGDHIKAVENFGMAGEETAEAMKAAWSGAVAYRLLMGTSGGDALVSNLETAYREYGLQFQGMYGTAQRYARTFGVMGQRAAASFIRYTPEEISQQEEESALYEAAGGQEMTVSMMQAGYARGWNEARARQIAIGWDAETAFRERASVSGGIAYRKATGRIADEATRRQFAQAATEGVSGQEQIEAARARGAASGIYDVDQAVGLYLGRAGTAEGFAEMNRETALIQASGGVQMAIRIMNAGIASSMVEAEAIQKQAAMGGQAEINRLVGEVVSREIFAQTTGMRPSDRLVAASREAAAAGVDMGASASSVLRRAAVVGEADIAAALERDLPGLATRESVGAYDIQTRYLERGGGWRAEKIRQAAGVSGNTAEIGRLDDRRLENRLIAESGALQYVKIAGGTAPAEVVAALEKAADLNIGFSEIASAAQRYAQTQGIRSPVQALKYARYTTDEIAGQNEFSALYEAAGGDAAALAAIRAGYAGNFAEASKAMEFLGGRTEDIAAWQSSVSGGGLYRSLTGKIAGPSMRAAFSRLQRQGIAPGDVVSAALRRGEMTGDIDYERILDRYVAGMGGAEDYARLQRESRLSEMAGGLGTSMQAVQAGLYSSIEEADKANILAGGQGHLYALAYQQAVQGALGYRSRFGDVIPSAMLERFRASAMAGISPDRFFSAAEQRAALLGDSRPATVSAIMNKLGSDIVAEESRNILRQQAGGTGVAIQMVQGGMAKDIESALSAMEAYGGDPIYAQANAMRVAGNLRYQATFGVELPNVLKNRAYLYGKRGIDYVGMALSVAGERAAMYGDARPSAVRRIMEGLRYDIFAEAEENAVYQQGGGLSEEIALRNLGRSREAARAAIMERGAMPDARERLAKAQGTIAERAYRRATGRAASPSFVRDAERAFYEDISAEDLIATAQERAALEGYIETDRAIDTYRPEPTAAGLAAARRENRYLASIGGRWGERAIAGLGILSAQQMRAMAAQQNGIQALNWIGALGMQGVFNLGRMGVSGNTIAQLAQSPEGQFVGGAMANLNAGTVTAAIAGGLLPVGGGGGGFMPMVDMSTGASLFERSMYGLNGPGMPTQEQVATYFANASARYSGAMGTGVTGLKMGSVWEKLSSNTQQAIVNAAMGKTFPGAGGIAGLQMLSNQWQFEISSRLLNAGAALSAKSARLQHEFTINYAQPAEEMSMEMERASFYGGVVETEWMKKHGIPAYNAGKGKYAWALEAMQLQGQDMLANRSQQMTRYQWQLEDLMREQQRFRVQAQWQRDDFALYGQRLQVNRQFQMQQFQWQAQEMGLQRQYYQEDFAFNRRVSQLQFGWQMEDYEQGIRRSTGYQRRMLIKQRDREVEMYGLQMEQEDKQKKRQEEAFKREEEHFRKQIEHWKQMNAFEDEEFRRQQERFEKQVEWREEDFDIRRERILQEMQWAQEAFDRQKRSFEMRKEQLEAEKSAFDAQWERKQVIFEAEKRLEEEKFKLSQIIIGMREEEHKSIQSLQQTIAAMREEEAIRVEKLQKLQLTFYEEMVKRLKAAGTNLSEYLAPSGGTPTPPEKTPGRLMPQSFGPQSVQPSSEGYKRIGEGYSVETYKQPVQVILPDGRVLAEFVLENIPQSARLQARRAL